MSRRRDCLLNNGRCVLDRIQLGRDATDRPTDLRTTGQSTRSRRESTMTRLHQRPVHRQLRPVQLMNLIIDRRAPRSLTGHILSHTSIRRRRRRRRPAEHSRNYRQRSVSQFSIYCFGRRRRAATRLTPRAARTSRRESISLAVDDRPRTHASRTPPPPPPSPPPRKPDR